MEDVPNPMASEPQPEAAEEKDGEINVSAPTSGHSDPASEETLQHQERAEKDHRQEQEQPIKEQQATAGAEPEPEPVEEIADEHQGEMVVEAEEDTVIY
jgi:hypothetical protein